MEPFEFVADPDPDPRPVVAAHRACKYDHRPDSCATTGRTPTTTGRASAATRRASAAPCRASAANAALQGYPAYLARAPGDSKLRYFYAELLWDQHRFAEAAEQYRAAAADQTAPFSEAAASAAVLARIEVSAAASPGRSRSRTRRSSTQPISTWRTIPAGLTSAPSR